MYFSEMLRRAARDAPGAELLADGERRLCAAELLDSSARLAGGLARLGLEPGDRLAVVARNCAEVVEVHCAASMSGIVLVPLNPRLATRELVALLAHAGARAVALDAAGARVLDEPGLDVRARVSIGFERPGCRSLAELSRGPADPPRVARGDGEEAWLLYTSGTTGEPKGVPLAPRQLAAVTRCVTPQLDLAAERDGLLVAVPLHHVAGLLMLACALSTRARAILIASLDPPSVSDAVARQRATHAMMVPAQLEWLLGDPDPRHAALRGLRRILYGAAPMSRTTLLRARERFGTDFVQGYGLTETAGVLTLLGVEEHREILDDAEDRAPVPAGRPIACCEVRVVGPGGEVLPAGEVGEIVARGDNVCGRYDADAPAERPADEFFHTGDAGRFDRSGRLTLVDRVKDVILVAGENVYPSEVERVLAAHPDVAESAVIARPHRLWGEQVHAVVVARAGVRPDEGELIRHCRERLARYKCPARVECRPALPRNAAGKIDRALLRTRDREGGP